MGHLNEDEMVLIYKIDYSNQSFIIYFEDLLSAP
jgi:hypothetical protein